MLRSIEQKIEGLFEGVFGRAFRTHVQPVELARKLVKEMEDHKVVSVSRVYVPNEYTVYLAPDDREQFANYEPSLLSELQDYIAENARRENYALLTPPRVLLESDDDLAMGEFGIATRMVQPTLQTAAADPRPMVHTPPGATMVYRQTPPAAEAAVPEVKRETVSLTVNGVPRDLTQRTVVIGRSKESDIQVADPNVSRKHAQIVQEGAAYWIVDLGSTNGLEVNGRQQKRAKLANGDRITIGSTEVVFVRETT
jgi:Protein of unknown function (DUF3662)/FHA domain